MVLLRATFFPPSLLLLLFLQNKETFLILLMTPFPGVLPASRQQHCPYIPVFQTKEMDSQVRPFKQFSSTKSSICIVPCICCCQGALQGLQEVWRQARAPQRDGGFICILLQAWWYQFWVASFAHPAISAVLHRRVIRDFSANYTKSSHILLFLGQKHCWRS